MTFLVFVEVFVGDGRIFGNMFLMVPDWFTVQFYS